MKGYIEINRELCKECLLCIHACKKGLIVTTNEFNARGYHPVRFEKPAECTGCALCAVTCPEVAIEAYRKTS